MKKSILALSLVLTCASLSSFASEMNSISPSNAKVYFVQPADGQTVEKNVKVIFGLSNMGVAPAGTIKKNTGHHHILIDTMICLI